VARGPAAAELLTSNEMADLRICASDKCAWLFWMGQRATPPMVRHGCGNRVKAQRHYQRVKANNHGGRKNRTAVK
jgi:predicted RNA-binding Zn ribbon-like protein